MMGAAGPFRTAVNVPTFASRWPIEADVTAPVILLPSIAASKE